MNQLSNLAAFWNVGNLTSLALIVLFATTAKAEPTSVNSVTSVAMSTLLSTTIP